MLIKMSTMNLTKIINSRYLFTDVVRDIDSLSYQNVFSYDTWG